MSSLPYTKAPGCQSLSLPAPARPLLDIVTVDHVDRVHGPHPVARRPHLRLPGVVFLSRCQSIAYSYVPNSRPWRVLRLASSSLAVISVSVF